MTAGFLPGVDRAAFGTAFAVRLRSAGLAVGLPRVRTFTRALQVAPPADRSALYWTARISLVGDVRQLPVFDAVFDAVFADAVLAMDPHARRSPPGPARRGDPAPRDDAARDRDGREHEPGDLPWITLPRGVQASDGPAGSLAVPLRLPAHLAASAGEPFDQLRPAEGGPARALAGGRGGDLADAAEPAHRGVAARPQDRRPAHAAGPPAGPGGSRPGWCARRRCARRGGW